MTHNVTIQFIIYLYCIHYIYIYIYIYYILYIIYYILYIIYYIILYYIILYYIILYYIILYIYTHTYVCVCVLKGIAQQRSHFQHGKPCRCPRASNSCARWLQAGALLRRRVFMGNSWNHRMDMDGYKIW